jgi:hypothetical protein
VHIQTTVNKASDIDMKIHIKKVTAKLWRQEKRSLDHGRKDWMKR